MKHEHHTEHTMATHVGSWACDASTPNGAYGEAPYSVTVNGAVWGARQLDALTCHCTIPEGHAIEISTGLEGANPADVGAWIGEHYAHHRRSHYIAALSPADRPYENWVGN